MRRPGLWFAYAVGLLALTEAARIYWIMPFPGSQRLETVELAYALHRAAPILRVLLGGALLWTGWRTLRAAGWRRRLAVGTTVTALLALFWATHRVMAAEAMFLPLADVRHAPAAASAVDRDALVLGLAVNGVARAYPIAVIGYHHQVRDTLGGAPVMVTYCTVCRSGRAFSPLVDGVAERFRLVGMDRWNAMFEDATTGSWWRQATGRAVVGPRAGRALAEVPARQMTLAAWVALHPATTVLEPDPEFAERYQRLGDFERGTSESELVGRDPSSWGEKSWVVGVVAGGAARAYDWNELTRSRLVADQLGGLPVLVWLTSDGASFVAYERTLDGRPLAFVPGEHPDELRDVETASRWSPAGVAVAGPLAGRRLAPLAAYQEHWHSWRTFQPQTTRHGG